MLTIIFLKQPIACDCISKTIQFFIFFYRCPDYVYILYVLCKRFFIFRKHDAIIQTTSKKYGFLVLLQVP